MNYEYNDMLLLGDRSFRRRVAPSFIPPPPAAHLEQPEGYKLLSRVAQANSGWVHPATAPSWKKYGSQSASTWAADAGWQSAHYETLSYSQTMPAPFCDQSMPVARGPSDPDTNTARSRSCFTRILEKIYLPCLLYLPTLYVSRVDEILRGVQRSKPDIQRRIASGLRNIPHPSEPAPVGATNSKVIDDLIKSWEYLVDSLIREWETLNIISVLLSAAILTTLQIDGAATDPYTRYSALLALVCSLMSLLYGSIYIMRFNTMRRTRKVVEWAEQAQKTTNCILWNIWVLLALPGIWFSWSFIFYLISVMTFVWRTGTTEDVVPQIQPLTALGPRIAITCTLVLGLFYLSLVICEFKCYGDAMDKKWRSRLCEWSKNRKDDYPSYGYSDPSFVPPLSLKG
ncbi:hypothetical protein H2248_010265 [Termitomyces sp. 'cryptogamus']|nr:hypothetical protein H2248_010265 [Termitomyces sp. 'cryptogamus']